MLGMRGYIISTTKNTNNLVTYNNEISIDYKEFLQGKTFLETELPLFYTVQKKADLNKVKKALILESSGPELISKRLKEILEVNTKNVQFFEVELYCEEEKIEGFYAINLPYKINCVNLEDSEYRLTNFDPNNPNYMFYYMKLKEDIFSNDSNYDIVRCKEMHRTIIISEKMKQILYEANLKGLQFSDSIDITPQERTVYEKI